MKTFNSAFVRPHKLVTCPYCESIDCGSNRLPIAAFSDMAKCVAATYRAGHSRHAIRTIAAWGALAIANALRPDTQCHSCGQSFQECGQ